MLLIARPSVKLRSWKRKGIKGRKWHIMFKKIHSIFHPNSQRRNVTDDIPYSDGAGSAVRLIRSTSMYVLGGEQEKVSEPLKKCRSTASIDSCFQPKEEDRDWMYAKTQDCLKYLQDLLALRKKYLENINNLKSMHMAADSPASTRSSKTGKKSFLPLPSKESSKVISKNFWHVLSLKQQNHWSYITYIDFLLYCFQLVVILLLHYLKCC